MRVAALYDVHAMPWALEAVLADLGDVDAIVFGGDFVGGPCVDETLALIESLDAVLIRGNAEDGDPRTATLPLTAALDGVIYCHATPAENTPITTVFTPDDELRAMFGERGTFVIGHTHHQFDRRVGELRVVNAGSIGMPYEGEVAAYWALVVDGEPTFRKTPIDVERAVAGIRASGWEGGEEFIAENLVAAVDRDEAARYFESQR
ncbi:MAG TPA: metallophosphoesterase family protein [Gaiellaceae bacterium]|nr:metallophosphoesterase family protein [Gaiellaceae bacterium]